MWILHEGEAGAAEMAACSEEHMTAGLRELAGLRKSPIPRIGKNIYHWKTDTKPRTVLHFHYWWSLISSLKGKNCVANPRLTKRLCRSALGMDFRIHVLLWWSTDTFPHQKYPQGNKNKSQNFTLSEIINAFAFFRK